MEQWLLSPPIVFLIFFVLICLFSVGMSRFASKGVYGKHKYESYACGQREVQNYVNPDYSEFFPFAFFFTIMHVIVLIVATAPYDAIVLPLVFIVAAILSMVIIFRR